MPECLKYGLRSRLLVSNLDSTLSKSIALTMGKTCQKDLAQINDTLINGRPLSEQEASITMFHASRSGGDMQLLTYIAPTADLPPPSSYMPSSDVPDYRVFPDQEEDIFTSGSRTVDKPQALSLLLEMTRDTFFDEGSGICNGKDISYEMYLNGELVQADVVTCRSLARSGYTVLQSGTRVHRQVEKPWTYEASHVRLNPAQSKKRLEAIGAKFAKRAAEKSCANDQRTLSGCFLSELARQPLPSLVQHSSKAYSVLDVIVVAGRGNKLGPGIPYLKAPTLSTDPRTQFVLRNTNHDTSSREAETGLLSPSPTTKLARQLTRKLDLSFASEDCLNIEELTTQHHQTNHFQPNESLLSNSRARTSQDFHENLDPRLISGCTSLDAVLNHVGSWTKQDTVVSFETHVTLDSCEDNIQQPHPDFAKLTPELLEHNHQDEQEEANVELTTTAWSMIGPATSMDIEYDAMFTGFATPIELTAQPCALISDPVPVASAVTTSLKRRRASSSPTPVKDVAGRSSHMRSPPALRHSQVRKKSLASPIQFPSKTAVEQIGTESDGQQGLIYGLATPKSRSSFAEPGNEVMIAESCHYATPAPTNASSSPGDFASSTKSAPQTPKRSAPRTPRQKEVALATPVRPGSHRTSKKWDPYEMSAEEAIKSFQPPALTRVGAIRYAPHEARRQVAKVRGTQFVEEVFLCGFRYFVE